MVRVTIIVIEVNVLSHWQAASQQLISTIYKDRTNFARLAEGTWKLSNALTEVRFHVLFLLAVDGRVADCRSSGTPSVFSLSSLCSVCFACENSNFIKLMIQFALSLDFSTCCYSIIIITHVDDWRIVNVNRKYNNVIVYKPYGTGKDRKQHAVMLTCQLQRSHQDVSPSLNGSSIPVKNKIFVACQYISGKRLKRRLRNAHIYPELCSQCSNNICVLLKSSLAHSAPLP